MNSFDSSMLAIVTRDTMHSETFSHAVRLVADFYLFKGVLPLAMLCALWFDTGERRQWQREMVVATILSGFLALFIGRVLACWLPFRQRPLYDPSLHLTFPIAATPEAVLRTWSSFPSDHAMIWAAVAMGIFLVSRWMGVLALLHCVFLICIPRVYLGLHYPTDVLAGMILGIGVTCLVTRKPIMERFAPVIVRFIDKYPKVSYAFLFVMLFELATMFDEPRQLAEGIFRHVLRN
ncbi:phosphoesterase [Burkholderia sp. SG-MS1]|uniref:phosphatase PAP2 family protein n=1 Tax=Paraburkholderia sp. SG-MS1 TaxID=2023741 RepID=UPI001446E9C9|nr:phosphatase PAP2 family protein [Paraburkholderia sp. SG-MS1]NKJ48139.1 phosphoesterase [Paraburkholderia sp. SG-MS1]